MPATPFIPKNPNDLIRAADWNQIQIDGREEVRSHDHSGGDQGVQLGTAALANGAVTAEKIADGTITAEKLDPNLELGGGGGTPDDDSVTTAKIANGAVTTAKLAQPLGALSSASLEVAGHRLRPVFDEVDLDWNWQFDGAPINLEQPSEEDLGEAFQNAEDIYGNLGALHRRALLILSRFLDPTLVLNSGAEGIYEKLDNPSLSRTLQRAGVTDEHIGPALEAMNDLWQVYTETKTAYPNLLFAISTMPQEVLDQLKEAGQNPIPAQSPRTLFTSAQSVAPNYSQHLSSAMLRPLGTIHPETGLASPPVVHLDPALGFSRLELEVEATATLRGSGYVGIGIGGLQAPPPLGSLASLGDNGVWGRQVRLTRRIPLFSNSVRQLRLWGIGVFPPFYNSNVVLVDATIRARTVGLTPNYAENHQLTVDPGSLDPTLANVSTTPIPAP